MAKTIRLTESELTKIIANLVKEESHKRKGEKGKKKGISSIKDLKKLTSSQFATVKKRLFSGSEKEILSNYRKLYNSAPKSIQSKSISPGDLKKEAGNLPPDDDPVVGYSIIISILAWILVAWSYCCYVGSCDAICW